MGLSACPSLVAYDGAGRELLARLKYRNARAALGWLAEGMADLVGTDAADAIDVVTWAPTTTARRRRRGFDQAELLARRVARLLGRPCRRLLVRVPGSPQTGLGRAERRVGPRFAFAPAAARPPPRRVLVVDDVVTTGASLTAAAAALREGGAIDVRAVAAARTPRHRR
jgi:ComF family protein